MKAKNRIRRKMLLSKSYWLEAVNGEVYDTLVRYMRDNGMKQKDLAQYLNISDGRVSQILNDGEINFTIDKLIEISLKLGKVPFFSLIDQNEYLEKELDNSVVLHFQVSMDENNNYSKFIGQGGKVVQLNTEQTFEFAEAYE
ncbi:helix-turn-helix domain-containing protein [Croceimicrobium hydrocarbonivorans]|uniref:Helix-turn-helix transcriptional regulator n=1 Tax=Croceimicrobium hydrocarbonivorans TaxID=2761580 RepID=A0A7H0VA49_9FLAO|nr:helix-turn-helix transcriptional regulator [Croceimicrobium hydrocarbonivorans]QNR22597.1 helix-turn-helix transcriptional regulator [Croceimicrobium hydrocarbonivorans]